MSDITVFTSEQLETEFAEFLGKQPRFTDSDNYRAKVEFRDFLIEEGLTKEEIGGFIGHLPFVIREGHYGTTALNIFMRHFARQLTNMKRQYDADFGDKAFVDILSKGVVTLDSANILKFKPEAAAK